MSADKVVEVIERIEVINLIGDRGNEVAIIEETVVEVETGTDHKEAEVSVELYSAPEHQRKHFRVQREATLLEILDEGAFRASGRAMVTMRQVFTAVGLSR